MNQSGIAQKVLRVLNENATRNIRFHFGTPPHYLTISSRELDRVAQAIEMGGITVVHDPRAQEYAHYDSDTNTITLKSDKMGERYEHTRNSKYERSFVIHECIHAAIDQNKAQATRVLASEAAAYLAQSLYLHQEWGDLFFQSWIDKGAESSVHALAEVYRRCLTMIERYKLLRKEVYLTDPCYKPLLRAIKSHPSYSQIPWARTESGEADGVRIVSPSGSKRYGCSIRQAIAAAQAEWMQANRPLAYQQHINNVRLLRQSVTQHLGGRVDPYSAEMWRDLSRIRPTQRAQWMQTNRPLAYQEHVNNARLLRQSVTQHLSDRVDPYSADTWRYLSRIRPTQRAQWMQINRPLAYQQHLANVGLLQQAARQQLRG